MRVWWVVFSILTWLVLELILHFALGLNLIASKFLAAIPLFFVAWAVRKERSVLRREQQNMLDREADAILERIQSGEQVNFCLYLRPFDLTHLIYVDIRAHLRWIYSPRVLDPDETLLLDEQIRNNSNMPIIKIGQFLSETGAGTLHVGEEAWKRRFVLLVKRAKIIFLVPWPTINSQWELVKIFEMNELNKLVIILPNSKMINGMVDDGDLSMFWIYVNNHLRKQGFPIPLVDLGSVIMFSGTRHKYTTLTSLFSHEKFGRLIRSIMIYGKSDKWDDFRFANNSKNLLKISRTVSVTYVEDLLSKVRADLLKRAANS